MVKSLWGKTLLTVLKSILSITFHHREGRVLDAKITRKRRENYTEKKTRKLYSKKDAKIILKKRHENYT